MELARRLSKRQKPRLTLTLKRMKLQRLQPKNLNKLTLILRLLRATLRKKTQLHQLKIRARSRRMPRRKRLNQQNLLPLKRRHQRLRLLRKSLSQSLLTRISLMLQARVLL
jgi:hypothetical protein